MKFEKKSNNYYETSHKAFINLYELRCNLIDFSQDYNFVVKDDIYPKKVVYMNCFDFKDHFYLDLFFETEYGEDMEYPVEIEIYKQNGKIKVKFESFMWEYTHQKYDEYMPYELGKQEFDDIVELYFPSVELLLKKLTKIRRNHPCSRDCYYKGEKGKNGKCDKLYISKKDFLSNKEDK